MASPDIAETRAASPAWAAAAACFAGVSDALETHGRRIRRWLLAGLAAAAALHPARTLDPMVDPMAALKADYVRPQAVPFPANDPFSPAKVRLGKMLFFEPLMSGRRTRSCATCHNPALSWGDGLPHAIGEEPLPLRSPTLLDVAWVPVLGWDGKFRTLESVAFAPMLSPANMDITEAEALRRLNGIEGYRSAFAAAFPDSPPEQAISRPHLEQALATFERTITAGPSPFDRWIEGDNTAIDAAAQRGFALFNGRAGCAQCHQGPSFTDGSFQDIGLAREEDVGRGRIFPDSTKLRHAFKVPTLRDVARRAPYMHDGSLPTLQAVVAFYNTGGTDRPSRSELIHPLGLSAREQADLVAFLRTLTGDQTPFEAPDLPR